MSQSLAGNPVAYTGRNAEPSGEMASGKEKERTNVGIPNDVHEAFSAWCEGRFAIKRDVLAAMIRRFLEMDKPAQTAFLGIVDEGAELAYAELLEALAKEVRAAAQLPGELRVTKVSAKKGTASTVKP